jgi:hypothetical protein
LDQETSFETIRNSLFLILSLCAKLNQEALLTTTLLLKLERKFKGESRSTLLNHYLICVSSLFAKVSRRV